MREYEYIFALALHSELKNKIQGGIFVNVYKDSLWVKITHECGIIYETPLVSDFSNRVLNGCSAEYAAYEVLKLYRRFIKDTFFK